MEKGDEKKRRGGKGRGRKKKKKRDSAANAAKTLDGRTRGIGDETLDMVFSRGLCKGKEKKKKKEEGGREKGKKKKRGLSISFGNRSHFFRSFSSVASGHTAGSGVAGRRGRGGGERRKRKKGGSHLFASLESYFSPGT